VELGRPSGVNLIYKFPVHISWPESISQVNKFMHSFDCNYKELGRYFSDFAIVTVDHNNLQVWMRLIL
jgi:hypothetical protein